MSYQYHYTGEEDVHLPAFGINATGGDREKVYETHEKINHPAFTLVEDTKEDQSHHEEAPQEHAQPEAPAGQPEIPEVGAQPTENVSEEGVAQVESV